MFGRVRIGSENELFFHEEMRTEPIAFALTEFDKILNLATSGEQAG